MTKEIERQKNGDGFRILGMIIPSLPPPRILIWRRASEIQTRSEKRGKDLPKGTYWSRT